MFSGILQRNTIQHEIQAILPHIYKIFIKELSMISGIANKMLNAHNNGHVTVIPNKNNCPEIFILLMLMQSLIIRSNALMNVQLDALITSL